MSRELAAHVSDLLQMMGPVTPRAMFGGYGIYLDGRMFALITDRDVLYFRTDDHNRPAYEAAGCGPFKPWPHKPMTMPYHEVPSELLDDPDELNAWARAAFAAALRAPAPKKRKKAASSREKTA